MKRKKPETLESKKEISSFILAIANGADINESYKGVPLVQHYFRTLRECGDILREIPQTTLKKLKVLVTVGADTRQIVYDDYDDLILNMCREMMLLSILLESDSAKKEITGFRLGLLKGFVQMLDNTSSAISDTGLIGDLEELPLPLEQLKQRRDKLNAVTSLDAQQSMEGAETLDTVSEDISEEKDGL